MRILSEGDDISVVTPGRLTPFVPNTPLVGRFRRRLLLEHIRQVNEEKSEPAQFTLKKTGLETSHDLPLSSRELEDALNDLESAGEVLVYRERGFDWDLFAVVPELAPGSVEGDLPFCPHAESKLEAEVKE